MVFLTLKEQPLMNTNSANNFMIYPYPASVVFVD